MAAGMIGADPSFWWMRYVPPKPHRLTRWSRPPVWSASTLHCPDALRTYPGSSRDAAEEERAFAAAPLHDFAKTHVEAVTWVLRHSWTWLIPTYPALRRALRRIELVRRAPRGALVGPMTPAALTTRIREEARRLGISAVGFTSADPKYTFAEYQSPGDANVIVCVLEQDWAATNTAPSSRAERAAFRTYGQLADRVAALAKFVKELGYDARPNDFLSGEAVAIHYAVEAGLGQLGLNGQLLTPAAGSRCRLALITTRAPVELGRPIDFGIPSICDRCQICVRRCPVGAIPATRREKRGVLKAAIKPERCFPIVAQAHGCAICMKVCPVQRYGLPRVVEHLERTGEILGKASDELEGYVWPFDGRYYAPGRTPAASSGLLNPPGWSFDRTRTAPPSAAPTT
jgi:epoxyqueuosine reductase QueG